MKTNKERGELILVSFVMATVATWVIFFGFHNRPEWHSTPTVITGVICAFCAVIIFLSALIDE